MRFQIKKELKVPILVVGTLFVVLIAAGFLNQQYQKNSLDPRVVQAHNLYEYYNGIATRAQYDSVFLLLDKIEEIYREIPHYRYSFEVGVLYNNRTATYIAMALESEAGTTKKDSLLNLAFIQAKTSINLYNSWLQQWQGLSEDEIREKVAPSFSPYDLVFRNQNVNRFIKKRVSQIVDAQIETPRRLSVARTNLGIVYRHKSLLDDAVKEYLAALELWPDNLAAENNLNVIFGKPLEKRSFFRRIFPKERL